MVSSMLYLCNFHKTFIFHLERQFQARNQRTTCNKRGSNLKIGTRLVVLNICRLGMLLLAELKYIGGPFDDDGIIPLKFPLKNFNWLNSVGLPALKYAGLLPRYDFIIVCGITVCATFELLDSKLCVVGSTNRTKNLFTPHSNDLIMNKCRLTTTMWCWWQRTGCHYNFWRIGRWEYRKWI